MLIADPTLPEITVSLSHLLYAFGISLNIAGAILLIRIFRRKRNGSKES